MMAKNNKKKRDSIQGKVKETLDLKEKKKKKDEKEWKG